MLSDNLFALNQSDKLFIIISKKSVNTLFAKYTVVSSANNIVLA